MRRYFVVGFALAMTASAARAQSAPAPSGSVTQSPKQAVAKPVTVEGCVMKEVDVPGRKPPENLRAQTEADDDYVLMSTKMVSGTAPSAPEKSTGSATGTSGTTASELMYDIEGIAKDQLKAQVGKRVQIEGVFDHLENAKLPVSFANDLVEIKGTTMRPVSGACPGQ